SFALIIRYGLRIAFVENPSASRLVTRCLVRSRVGRRLTRMTSLASASVFTMPGARRINITERIVQHVGIPIQRLRISYVHAAEIGIRRHPAALRARVLTEPSVIQERFAVAFVSCEFMSGKSAPGDLLTVG